MVTAHEQTFTTVYTRPVYVFTNCTHVPQKSPHRRRRGSVASARSKTFTLNVLHRQVLILLKTHF